MSMSKSRRFEETEAYRKRLERARNTSWKAAVAGPNSFAIRGADSDSAHLVETSGTDALRCSCPDFKHNLGAGGKCKHMLAYEEWNIDEVMG